MAEILGVAASAASFIGLAGQILQGCQNIRTLLDDIKGATVDLQNLSREVSAFDSALRTFRELLVEIEKSGVDISSSNESIVQALEFSDMAMEGLGTLVSRYSKNDNLGWKRQVSFALRKEKVGKYSKVLERAKLHVLSAQANVNLSVSYANSKILTSNTAVIHSSAETVSSIPAMFQTLHEAISATGHTTLSVRQDLSAQLANLPPLLQKMIEQTLAESLAHHWQNSNSSISPEVTLSQGYTRGDSATHSNSVPSSSDRVHQTSWKQRFETWFGTVAIISTSTSQEHYCTSDLTSAKRSASKTLTIDITPSRLLLRLGVMLTCYQPYKDSGYLASDLRLRVYRVVPFTAPVVQACRLGVLEDVQHLFATGHASPFDRLSGQTNLLDIVMSQVWAMIALDDEDRSTSQTCLVVKDISKMTRLYRYLVDQGLDPDISSSHTPYVQWIMHAALLCEIAEFLPCISELVRIIVTTSTESPYLDRTTLGSIQWWVSFLTPSSPFYSLLQSILVATDQFNLPKCTPSFKLGIGSWDIRAAVLRDPEAVGLRNRLTELKRLKENEKISEMLLFLSQIPAHLRHKGFGRGSMTIRVKDAAENYLKVGLEFGLPISRYPWDDLYLRLYVCETESFRDIPQRQEWSNSTLPDWLDEEATASLVSQLFYLDMKKHQRQVNYNGNFWPSNMLYFNDSDVGVCTFESVRKRLRYHRTWRTEWEVYIEAYDRKDWDYRLPGFQKPAWEDLQRKDPAPPVAHREESVIFGRFALNLLFNFLELFLFLV